MTTYASLRSMILRILSDPGGDSTDDGLVHDGVCAALDAVLPWHAQRKLQTISGDGTSVSFGLASDLYEIDAVVDVETGVILPRATLAPGIVRGANMAGDNNWIEYPSGTLLFSRALGSDKEVRVFYRAHWEKPESENDASFELTIPEFLEGAVAIYSAAYCMMPKAVETATVRQYATKVDSGNPEHNPMADRVNFLMKLFVDEVSRHPRQVAGATTS